MLIDAMGSTMMNTNQQLGYLAQTLGDRDGNQGYRALKPKKEMTRVTGADARVVMSEFAQFEVDLNELGLSQNSEAAYRQLRAMTEGKAKDVVDLSLVQGTGLQLIDQLNLMTQQKAPQMQRDFVGARLYNLCKGNIEDSVRLTATKRLQIAEEIYNEAKMFEDTPREAEAFLARWRRARYLMYKEGLVGPDTQQIIGNLGMQGTDPGMIQVIEQALGNSQRREMNNFLEHRLSESVYEWIKSQPDIDQPRSIEGCITLIEKYCEVKAHKLDKPGKPVIKKIDGGREVTFIDGIPFAVGDARLAAAQQSNGSSSSEHQSDGVSLPAGVDPQVSTFNQAGNAGYLASLSLIHI